MHQLEVSQEYYFSKAIFTNRGQIGAIYITFQLKKLVKLVDFQSATIN